MLIGELAAEAGVPAKTIRFYEQAGLMPAPPRTPAGYRDYPPGALDRLAFIRHAQVAGFTLAEIRSVLVIRDSGDPPCRHVATLIGQHLAQVERLIAELTGTHDVLIDLQRRAAAINPADCAEPEICSILTTAQPTPASKALPSSPARHRPGRTAISDYAPAGIQGRRDANKGGMAMHSPADSVLG
jgi:MerR family transcriptional regulator, copper efflux regulator